MGSATSKYVYVGWHMVGEHDGSAWLWQEVPMPGEEMLEHMALDTNDLDGDSNTTEIRQYGVHTDFQATVWSLTDTSGNIVERYRYREPYGDTYTQNAAGTNIGDFASNVYHNKRLHGGVMERDNRIYDYRNRWMLPQNILWLSRDPWRYSKVYNFYEFVRNAPTTKMDPYGLFPDQTNEQECQCMCNVIDFEFSRLRMQMSCDSWAQSREQYGDIGGVYGTTIDNFCANFEQVQYGGCGCEDEGACAEIDLKANPQVIRFCCMNEDNTHPESGWYDCCDPAYKEGECCEQLLDHEWAHVSCLFAANLVRCSDHSGEPENRFEDCTAAMTDIMNGLATAEDIKKWRSCVDGWRGRGGN